MRLRLSPNDAGRTRGQSLVELALIIPLVLILLLGMVEVGFLIFNYLNLLDLTREAARFASVRDWRMATSGPSMLDDCVDNTLDYYKDTACFFLDPSLNANLPFDEDKYDDVTISVFVVEDSGTQASVSRRLPQGQIDEDGNPIDPDGDGVWSQSGNNWQRDCDGTVIESEPIFTNEEVETLFVADAPRVKGLVLVEGFICYDMMLSIPLLSDIIGSPFRLHTYTFMPAPEAIPTPTPIP